MPTSPSLSDDQEQFEREKQQLRKKIQRQLTRALKRKFKCEEDFVTFSQWEKIQHEGRLIQANLFQLKKGMTEAVIHDWESDAEVKIALNPQLEPKEIAEALFHKSKKYRRGLTHIDRRMQAVEKEIASLQELQKQLSAVTTSEDLLQFNAQMGPSEATKKEEREARKKLPYHEFMTAAGLPLWVGKSAKDNDTLTFHYAKGSDWWLHVSDFSGSHVILRVPKGQEPDDASLKEAMQAALTYSKAKSRGEADICITQCKYVSRIGKGNPGKVQISKHKVVFFKNINPLR